MTMFTRILLILLTMQIIQNNADGTSTKPVGESGQTECFLNNSKLYKFDKSNVDLNTKAANEILVSDDFNISVKLDVGQPYLTEITISVLDREDKEIKTVVLNRKQISPFAFGFEFLQSNPIDFLTISKNGFTVNWNGRDELSISCRCNCKTQVMGLCCPDYTRSISTTDYVTTPSNSQTTFYNSMGSSSENIEESSTQPKFSSSMDVASGRVSSGSTQSNFASTMGDTSKGITPGITQPKFSSSMDVTSERVSSGSTQSNFASTMGDTSKGITTGSTQPKFSSSVDVTSGRVSSGSTQANFASTMGDTSNGITTRTSPSSVKTTPITSVPKKTTPGFPKCQQSKWSEWINHNHANNSGNEEEQLSQRERQKLCTGGTITHIECREVGTQTPFDQSISIATCDVKHGLQCKHSENIILGCLDFEMRLYCKCQPT